MRDYLIKDNFFTLGIPNFLFSFQITFFTCLFPRDKMQLIDCHSYVYYNDLASKISEKAQHMSLNVFLKACQVLSKKLTLYVNHFAGLPNVMVNRKRITILRCKRSSSES